MRNAKALTDEVIDKFYQGRLVCRFVNEKEKDYYKKIKFIHALKQ